MGYDLPQCYRSSYKAPYFNLVVHVLVQGRLFLFSIGFEPWFLVVVLTADKLQNCNSL